MKKTTSTRPPSVAILSRTIGDRAAFYLQPSYIFHSNTYSTTGCLEHLEHGHDIPGCVEPRQSASSRTRCLLE